MRKKHAKLPSMQRANFGLDVVVFVADRDVKFSDFVCFRISDLCMVS